MISDDDNLRERLRKAEQDLESLLELAAHFQDDYAVKLPVIAAFRQWRGGHLSSDQFLELLRGADVAPATRYEKVPSMRGLAILSKYRNRETSTR